MCFWSKHIFDRLKKCESFLCQLFDASRNFDLSRSLNLDGTCFQPSLSIDGLTASKTLQIPPTHYAHYTHYNVKYKLREAIPAIPNPKCHLYPQIKGPGKLSPRAHLFSPKKWTVGDKMLSSDKTFLEIKRYLGSVLEKTSPPFPSPSKFDKTPPNPQGPLDTNNPP